MQNGWGTHKNMDYNHLVHEYDGVPRCGLSLSKINKDPDKEKPDCIECLALHDHPKYCSCSRCLDALKADDLPNMDLDKGGVKYDQGKDPWHLLDMNTVAGCLKVLAYGAKKYRERNWEAGMNWSRPYAALLRHITAWWMGEDNDPETGLPHLDHAQCCIHFLSTYARKGVGTDDRPNRSNVRSLGPTVTRESFTTNHILGERSHTTLCGLSSTDWSSGGKKPLCSVCNSQSKALQP